MENFISKQQALAVLQQDAAEICDLLGKQSNILCRTVCPAFEEVADTRIYGFSCEVKFLIRSGLLTTSEGHQLIKELEEKLGNIQARVTPDVGVEWE